MIYCPHAMHATQVMDTVHQQDLTLRAAAPNAEICGNRDRRAAARYARAERRFSDVLADLRR
jgi:hypothetical protein